MRPFFLAVTRNTTSMAGTALTTASAILFASLFLLESTGLVGTGPYVGILAFLVLPGIFLLGLALIPLGLWRERRRSRRSAGRSEPPATLPVWDLNVPATRKNFLVFVALTCVNVVILGVAAYKGIEVMDSTTFCGTACHSVMAPEYANYLRSPHARVACVACHIGPGANWFVKSKLSGSWQLVAVTFNLYPRPIPTPVANLRPARETCEQCHWPSKFIGDRLKILTRYEEDEANTETKTVLLLRVGGIQGRTARGIHWHVDPSLRIRYRSDAKRETIGEVEMTSADGTVRRFRTGAATEAGADWRTMDCVDCHNRPTHIYRMPEDEIDEAIQQGRIDRSLPFVRREGLAALRQDYGSPEQVRAGILARLTEFYSRDHPRTASSKRAEIEAAAEELARIHTVNVWPSMNIRWGSYPDHIGHRHTAGCFRCHDGEHRAEDGGEISQDCTTCHTLLAEDEPSPAILEQLNP